MFICVAMKAANAFVCPALNLRPTLVCLVMNMGKSNSWKAKKTAAQTNCDVSPQISLQLVIKMQPNAKKIKYLVVSVF